jgi:hypothetical protein
MDPALALRWGRIAADNGSVLPLDWKPGLLAALLPFADATVADGKRLTLRGELEGGKRWAVSMLLPLADGRAHVGEGRGAA